MQRAIWATLLITSCMQAQSTAAPPSATADTTRKADSGDDLFPTHRHGGRVGLIRGVLKQVDPIYNQFVIHTFGDGEIRIALDGQTKFLAENGGAGSPNIPAGSVLSVDTVMDEGKLFATLVRLGTTSAAELNGQVVRYEPFKSELILRDPISPQNVTVRVTSNTKIVNRGKTAYPQRLSRGMLVRVLYSGAEGAQKVASEVEILAARGDSFTFEGRIIAVDLHSRVLSLSNSTDQSLRELVFGTLDANSISLLREGALVSIQAEFDGTHYNVRAVSPVPENR